MKLNLSRSFVFYFLDFLRFGEIWKKDEISRFCVTVVGGLQDEVRDDGETLVSDGFLKNALVC
jgi:hypothetical protein